jgi:hypothetical protein
MRILAIALAAVTLLSLAGLAEATTLNGVGNVPTATRDYSPVEKVAAVRVVAPMELTGFADRMVDADAFRVATLDHTWLPTSPILMSPLWLSSISLSVLNMLRVQYGSQRISLVGCLNLGSRGVVLPTMSQRHFAKIDPEASSMPRFPDDVSPGASASAGALL